MTAPTRRCEKVAKAVSRSLSMLALTTMNCTLRPAACKPAMMDGVLGKDGPLECRASGYQLAEELQSFGRQPIQ